MSVASTNKEVIKLQQQIKALSNGIPTFNGVGYSQTGHAHTINDVSGLQTALDNKQNNLIAGNNIVFEGNTIKATVNPTAWTDITGKPTTFAPSSHNNHIISDVLGLQTALDNKQNNLTAGDNISIDSNNRISANGGGGASQWTTSGTSVYYNAGSVGIGTTSPNHKLQLFSDNVSTNMYMNITANVVRDVGIILERPAGTTWIMTNKGSGYTTSANNLAFTNGATNVLELTSSGNVGIGTVSPDHKLHLFSDSISANTHIKLTANVVRDVGIVLERPAGTTWDITNKGSGYGAFQNNLAFTNGATNALELTPSGNVGVGTGSPEHRLHLFSDNISTNMHMKLTANVAREVGIILERPAGTTWTIQNKGSGYGTSANNLAFTNGATNALELTPSGNVGIGVIPATDKLEVEGNIKCTGSFIAGSMNIVTELSNRAKQGTHSFSLVNDYFLNIRPVDYTTSFPNFPATSLFTYLAKSTDSQHMNFGFAYFRNGDLIKRVELGMDGVWVEENMAGAFKYLKITNKTGSTKTFEITFTAV